MVNFLNLYVSSFAIFSQEDLHEFPFSVPHEFRDNAGFQLKVIESLYSKLIDFPVFTHRRYHNIDRERSVLVPIPRHGFKSKFNKIISSFLLLKKDDSYKKSRRNDKRKRNEFEVVVDDTVKSIIKESIYKYNIKLGGKYL